MSSAAQSPFDNTMRMPAMRRSATTGPRVRLSQLTEPHILFPALTVFVLGVIWSATLNLIKVERTNGERAAAAATLELLNTYDAQVVRALAEIDQTLKLVKYVSESKRASAVLSDLKVRTLLPPDVLFLIRIVNGDGTVVASTRPTEVGPARDLGIMSALRDASYFVSGYEPAQLGKQGALGLLGTDGVFRVRRTLWQATNPDAFDGS